MHYDNVAGTDLKRVATLGWLFLTIGLIWIVRDRFPVIKEVDKIVLLPAVPETLWAHLPVETLTVFIVERDTINTVVTRTVFDTVRVSCQELVIQRRILAAVFGAAIGDTALILSELMNFERDSLTFQQTTERLYMLGMPKRIGTDLEGATVEWQEFPTVKINSCSIWSRIAHLSVGLGSGILIGEVF